MSFILIMKEKYPSEHKSYRELDPDREVIYLIYEITTDSYGNTYKNIIHQTESLHEAKKLLRSIQLKYGIEIKP